VKTQFSEFAKDTLQTVLLGETAIAMVQWRWESPSLSKGQGFLRRGFLRWLVTPLTSGSGIIDIIIVICHNLPEKSLCNWSLLILTLSDDMTQFL